MFTPQQKKDRLEMLQAAIAVEQRRKSMKLRGAYSMRANIQGKSVFRGRAVGPCR